MSGTLYALPSSAEPLFQHATTKSEWYQAMQQAGVSEATSLYAEESFPAWEYAVEHSVHSETLGRLFLGDANSRSDATGGPDVALLKAASVQALALALAEVGESEMRRILGVCGHEADFWLYSPLRQFVELAASRRQSLVVLSGV